MCTWIEKDKIKTFDISKTLRYKTINDFFYVKHGVFGNYHMRI